MQRGVSAAKDCLRIFSTTVLSLLPPLWLLLLARIAAARHHTWVPNYENLYMISILLHSVTTFFLIVLIFAAAIAALVQGFAGDKRALFISERRRLHGAVIWLSLIQICLSLWVHGVAEGGDRVGAGGGAAWNPVSLRSVVMVLGLHKMVVFWRRHVVKPAVDEVEEGFGWMEKAVLAVAFGCLWWRWLRREVEEMVVVVVMRGDQVEVVDVVGWLMCGLMAAAGGATVVKGLLWLLTKILRQHATMNEKILAVDRSWDSKSEIETAV